MTNFNDIINGSLSIARSFAFEKKNTQIEPSHILYGLVKNPATYLSKVFAKDIDKIIQDIDTFAKASNIELENIGLSTKSNEWITLASSSATQNGASQITEKDLVKYLAKFFSKLDLDFSKLKDDHEQNETPSFLVNLNEKAKSSSVDPVIGRTKEIRSVMEILARRTKNNPVLVGPAGVGKTAIVEGLAHAIVKGDVSDILKNKTIYSMDLGSLVAGTKYRGDFEKRIQSLLKFAKDGAGEHIIFIDEIHQIIGTGKTDGAMDAANLLKPALSRGELHCIGATTEDEYQKHILNDPALERRFRQVSVFEPSHEDAIEILMGIRDKYEAHHGINISDEAIYSAVKLSSQYITNKFLPDKAIDLIDEAASALKVSAKSMPAELELLKANIRNKNILLKVKPTAELEKEINELQKKFDTDYQAFLKEVASLNEVKELKEKLDQYKFDLENAQRTQDYELASQIKFSLIPEIEAKLQSFDNNWSLKKKDIANVIARQTGIPASKILKEKQDSILELADNIKKDVFSQGSAIDEICATLTTSYAGLSDPTRPLGSFLLKGPTGVGKTQTAKSLAKNLFDDEDKIVRIDLSEFSEKHSVSKLIGAPAGYVGYDDGGVLTEAIRRKPYSVILFDEVEKA
ncbi:MAG: AAA family ATPase, partial [Bacteriovoracaceae bacterium]|nr:AAA family ATPase [Bacteriovoracaceae bacterium]